MNLWGGDLASMDSLATKFEAEAGEVTRLQQTISSVLTGTGWTGPARDVFERDWQGTFVPALTNLREALTENARVVRNRRTAIEQATSLAR